MWEKFYSLEHQQQKMITLIFLSILIAIGVFSGKLLKAGITSLSNSELVSEVETAELAEDSDEIFVYVHGAVKKPGVYAFKAGDRVFQAIDEAAPLEEASLDDLNLAAYLEDGTSFFVPKKEVMDYSVSSYEVNRDEHKSPDAPPMVKTGEQKVSINRGTQEDLEKIPSIGPQTAKLIIEGRKRKGSFKSFEDLLEIKGIGPKTLEKIKDYAKL